MIIPTPKTLCAAGAALMMTVAATHAAMAFNPQPEPPEAAKSFKQQPAPALRKAKHATGGKTGGILRPKLGGIRGFNPQPEPPMKSVGPLLRR